MLKITTRLLLAEAERLGWETEVLDDQLNMVRYTTPAGKDYYVQSVVTHKTSVVHRTIADHKYLFHRIADRLDVRVPKTIEVNDWQQAYAFVEKHAPAVVKPENSGHGNGVTINISTTRKLKKAVKHAQRYSSKVLLQEQVSGEDYRLLFIGSKLCAAAKRVPANVTGDGKHTVGQLINQENKSDARADNYEKPLNYIDAAAAKRYLGSRLRYKPELGEVVQVVGTANMGTGGYSVDVTDEVPASMRRSAQAIIDGLGIPVCGVDFLVSGEDAYVVEINASPSFALHMFPFEGKARNVANDFLRWLETT